MPQVSPCAYAVYLFFSQRSLICLFFFCFFLLGGGSRMSIGFSWFRRRNGWGASRWARLPTGGSRAAWIPGGRPARWSLGAPQKCRNAPIRFVQQYAHGANDFGRYSATYHVHNIMLRITWYNIDTSRVFHIFFHVHVRRRYSTPPRYT